VILGTGQYHFQQLPPTHTDPERHNTQRHRQRDRQTDDSIVPIADHSLLRAAMLSAEKAGEKHTFIDRHVNDDVMHPSVLYIIIL